ncbi:VF530 family DNA-binding protein [Shewanella sp. OMA3-2]|uniref:VF530 family protein n=1 Tax=Shewanella sp. OMA3-2 TaxID=2908650 RepID=UPI001F35BCB9|nr:VF530 family protein [Shewanella sp. OMA3-2]UJF20406.1 VF530 family protein [Shewanella sp. OMA3-2]
MTQQNNPLHGIKLETIITYLVDKYGWEDLALRINIRCFQDNPSIKSSLTFLRKTPWARDKVEYLYLRCNKLPLPIKKEQDIQPTAPFKKTANKKASAKVTNTKATNTKVQSVAASDNTSDTKPVNANIWGGSH